MKTQSNTTTPVSDDELHRQVTAESLRILYRGLPNAALGHVVTASFVVYGLAPIIDHSRLQYWWLAVVVFACARLVLSVAYLRRAPTFDDNQVRIWSASLSGLALLQTCTWGTAAVILWPPDLPYRAFLVAVLTGIIAIGGVMLAVHRRSFWIYCFPIAVPTLYMLLTSTGRLEYIMAALMILFSGLILVSVNRLTQSFHEGIGMRFRLQALSRTDPLTQLTNRRGFEEFLAEIWQQSIRTAQPVGLLGIDVDQFKKYNDRYGHPQGDVALKRIAGVLRDVASRSTDLCARLGGEEFFILLAATDLEGCVQVAQQVREQLRRENIVHEETPEGYVTVSIGIHAMTPGRDDLTEDLIGETDRALYRAKELGRDRVETAEMPAVGGNPAAASTTA